MDSQDPVLARLIDQVGQARAQRVPLDIRGGGTKIFYGGPPKGEPLDVRDLAGISSYEPTELVVTARAGTVLAELEGVLADQGQCLPFEPPRFAAGGTVGGMTAAGLSGPARASAGSVRDHVLGVTLLNGRGEVLTFGGQVAKNVAGYDVSRLLVGSLGILGVICEVSLKVLPVNRATATLCFEWNESRALEQLNLWASQPLPIHASAWQEGRLYLRLSGAVAAVNAACGQLGGTLISADAAAAWWLGLRDQTQEFFVMNGNDLAGGDCLWRLSLPSTAAPVKLPGRQIIEWHGAERWWRTGAAPEAVRAAAAGAGGHATLIRGADKSGAVFTPLPGALLRIHRGLKQAFDPACIFNPGRLYAEL
ncbi:MAG: glycolate oxidase subunit GlcE [Steroidobacteraceae bacterium]